MHVVTNDVGFTLHAMAEVCENGLIKWAATWGWPDTAFGVASASTLSITTEMRSNASIWAAILEIQSKTKCTQWKKIESFWPKNLSHWRN